MLDWFDFFLCWIWGVEWSNFIFTVQFTLHREVECAAGVDFIFAGIGYFYTVQRVLIEFVVCITKFLLSSLISIEQYFMFYFHVLTYSFS